MIFRKAFISAIALASTTLSACSAPETNDGIVMVEAGDEAIAAARAEARRTLPQFWERLAAPTMFESKFGVKFDLNHGHPERGDAELIWTSDVVKNGDVITARLANLPLTEGFEEGQSVQFTEAAIVDWQIERNGKLEGHYSTRVLLSKMAPEDAAPIQEMLW